MEGSVALDRSRPVVSEAPPHGPTRSPAAASGGAAPRLGWRGRQLARRGLGLFPLTGRSLALGGAAALAYFVYAREQLDLVLLAASLLAWTVIGAALVGVLTLAFLVARRWPAPSMDRPLLQAEADSPVITGFSGPGVGPLPLLRVRWAWSEPAGVRVQLLADGFQQQEQVTFGRRALGQRVRREVVIEDVLGLARLSWSRESRQPLRVLPRASRGPLAFAQGPVTGDGVSHPDGRPEGDRVELRRYVLGDPLRYVVWPVFARTRRLMVRAPERAVVPSKRTLAYLVADPDDEPAAAAARTALERGLLGDDWTFGADGAPGLASHALDEALGAVAGSARATPAERDGAGLPAFLGAACTRTASRLVLFAPPSCGGWLERAAAQAALHALPVTVVVGVEALAPAPATARSRLARLLLRPPPAGPALTLEALRPLLERLAASRLDWFVSERSSGRAHLPGQFAAALAEGRG